jgi:hypothetical protein
VANEDGPEGAFPCDAIHIVFGNGVGVVIFVVVMWLNRRFLIKLIGFGIVVFGADLLFFMVVIGDKILEWMCGVFGMDFRVYIEVLVMRLVVLRLTV